jgi:transposase-like protein
VSTRKVDRLVEALGLAGVSKDQVSRLCQGLDEQVTAFGERPLESAYPYLWLDAKVEKVRAGGRVEHRALVVADGVDATGQREVLGIDVGAAETEAFWREFRWPGCCWRPRPTCWPSPPSRLSIGPSCAAPTRWSGSTARSADAPT